MRRWISLLVVMCATAVAAWATPAFAQDYTVTTHSTGTRVISSAGLTTTQAIGGGIDDGGASVTLPFTFSYYGRAFNSAWVCSNGFVQFGGSSTDYLNAAISGNTTSGSGRAVDGALFAYWDDLTTSSGSVQTFTSGSAPNRVFVFEWRNVAHLSQTSTMTFQIQLFETGGRILFAYNPASGTWPTQSYSLGIDAPSDTRFVVPSQVNNTASNTGVPPNDFQFDPSITTFSGRVLMDAVVSDATGFGNSTVRVPAAGMGVELRDTGSQVLAATSCLADGSFSLQGGALDSRQTGSVYLVTSGAACRVSPSTTGAAAASYSKVLQASISFGSNATIPDYTLDDATDPGATFRAPAQILVAAGRANLWVRARTTKTIPRLEVFYDRVTSTEVSRYVEGANPYLRIGSPRSGNEDAFDAGIVIRGYARHIVKSMTGATTNANTLALDTVTDGVNALCDGMGAYLYAMVDNQTREYDGLSSTQATVFDFETPTMTSARGSSVGGWFAAAMFDLVDGTGTESHDTVDGGSGTNAERPFLVFNSLTTLSMTDFVLAWAGRGYPDSAGLVLNLVHHGILGDDASEFDGTPATAHSLGNTGARSTARTLNPYNEDWYVSQVTAATTDFVADMTYNRSGTDAVIEFEIRNASNSVIATGAWSDLTASIRARTGALQPGTYYVRVAHVGGGAVGNYDIQVFSQPGLNVQGATEWTQGRPLVQSLNVFGGIPPYTMRLRTGSVLPPGMNLDSQNARVSGTPSEVGTSTYTINVEDSGSPKTTLVAPLSLTVNAPLRFAAPRLLGIAAGRPTNLSVGRSGGTDPIDISNFVGNLPTGLSFSDELTIVGTATSTGGGRISFVATDPAGSTANFSTTLVSCARLDGGRLRTPLAAADGAAGFYFDAISGSSATVTVTTLRRQPRRQLSVLVIGPDGSEVTGGAVSVGLGTIRLRNVPLQLSGRYFVVYQGADSGGATNLQATLRVGRPSRGGGSRKFYFGDSYEFDVGAFDGSTMVLQGRTTYVMAPRVAFLQRPDESYFPLDQIGVVESPGRFRFHVAFDMTGTWRFTIAPKPGPVGEMFYTYVLRHPRNATYDADEDTGTE